MNTQSWLEYFRRNETRSSARLSADVLLSERLRAPLASALRTFQAGETGEGRIVHQARSAAPGDAAFQESLRLYIAEEGRHARELGMLVRALGGSEHVPVATARVFEHARRAIGFWTKMAILTAAEVVGIVFYDLLAERVPSPELARVVAQISKEERAHVLFQRDAFVALAERGRMTKVRRAGLSLALGASTAAAMAVFAIDQRVLLGELGVGPRELAGRAAAVVAWARSAPSSNVTDRRPDAPIPAGAPVAIERPRSAAPFAWIDAA